MKTSTQRVLTSPEGTFVHDRNSGLCAFTPKLKSHTWTRPLFAQIAITEKCDINPPCPWCYAQASPNKNQTWLIEDLMELLKFLDHWRGGLLGVAYGGGEPFTHPDIIEIVKRTWNETGLDVSLTTNGRAATPEALAALEGYIGEVRVSIYDPSDCRIIEKFLNQRFDLGVNILLKTGGVPDIEKTIETCANIGIRDFLINSLRAVGRATRDMEPTQEDYQQLAKLAQKLKNKVHFKVSTRTAEQLQTYAKLPFIPFESQARGRIIAITADKKVKPSSTSTEAYAFVEPNQIPAIYANHFAT